MAQANKEIQATLNAIDNGLITWNEAMPKIQEQIYRRLLQFQRELGVQGDTITNSVKNIKLLSSLKSDLETIILDDSDYSESVTKFAKLYDKVNALNFSYYKALEKKFKPPKVVEAIRQQSISVTLEGLTESGLNQNLITPVREIINTYVTTGGSYSKLSKELNNYINGTPTIDGALVKYTQQIATDSINQYNSILS
jgi:hypothetical protein